MDKFIQPIIVALLGTGVIVVAYMLVNQYIYYQAVDRCLTVSRDQFVRNEHTLTGPDGFWYDFCMKEKGLK